MRSNLNGQRFKLGVAGFCGLVLPMLGLLISGYVIGWDGLTGGATVGGFIGWALYFGIAHRELKLNEHWKDFARSVPCALVLFACVFLVSHSVPLAVYAFFAMIVLATMMPPLHALDQKQTRTEPTKTVMKTREKVGLSLCAAVLFGTVWLVPTTRFLVWIPLSLFAVFLVLCGVVMLVKYRALHSPHQKAACAYQEHCDPRPMLAECERRLSRRMGVSTRQGWLNQQAVALTDLGDYEGAIQILNALLSSEQILPNDMHAACLVNLTEVFCRIGRIDLATEFHAKAKTCLGSGLSENMRQGLLACLREQEGTLMYCTGDFQGAKQHFQELGWGAEVEDSAQTWFLRVSHAYKLGLVYLETGDMDLARENLAVAAAHGNYLALAAEAERILCAIV